jgi:flagellar protein FlaG
MSTTQPIPAIPSDVAPAQPVQSPAPVNAGASQASSAQADSDADLRLVIEEDKAAGSYVYKTVDSRTGKVVSQMPREELLRMREASSYAPGSVVNSRT